MAELKQAKVPDIGNYTNIPVIEVLVKPGDTVARDQGLVTLESDKATMEVPAPFAGVVKEVKVKLGDEVSEGHVVAVIETGDAAAPAKPAAPAKAETPAPAAPAVKPVTPTPAPVPAPASTSPSRQSSPPVNFGADTVMPGKVPLASPVVRLIARELGVDLTQVTGSERHGRITKQDVRAYVKRLLEGGGVAGVPLKLADAPHRTLRRLLRVTEKCLRYMQVGGDDGQIGQIVVGPDVIWRQRQQQSDPGQRLHPHG